MPEVAKLGGYLEDDLVADTAELYPSDDESGADGVSSGVSHSDCDSPTMGLSAFDGPLRDVPEPCTDGRSALLTSSSGSSSCM